MENKTKDIERERLELQADRSRHKMEVESFQLSTREREKNLYEQKMDLERSILEFEARRTMISPHILAAEKDREDGRATKSKAEEVMAQANERLSQIISTERVLIARESGLVEREKRVEASEARLVDEKRRVFQDLAQIRGQQQLIKNEKFRLHNIAMDLSRRSFDLERYLRGGNVKDALNVQRYKADKTIPDEILEEEVEDKPSIIEKSLRSIYSMASVLSQQLDDSEGSEEKEKEPPDLRRPRDVNIVHPVHESKEVKSWTNWDEDHRLSQASAEVIHASVMDTTNKTQKLKDLARKYSNY